MSTHDANPNAVTTDYVLAPEEQPEAYYGAGFLDRMIELRKTGSTPEELLDMLCEADLAPILADPAIHLPHYVKLLTTDTPEVIGEGSAIYDRYNEQVLSAILDGTSLQDNADAIRTLRVAFAINAHGVLVEAIKGEDRASLMAVSKAMRQSLFTQLQFRRGPGQILSQGDIFKARLASEGFEASTCS
jgi:hypothetical protein